MYSAMASIACATTQKCSTTLCVFCGPISKKLVYQGADSIRELIILWLAQIIFSPFHKVLHIPEYV